VTIFSLVSDLRNHLFLGFWLQIIICILRCC